MCTIDLASWISGDGDGETLFKKSVFQGWGQGSSGRALVWQSQGLEFKPWDHEKKKKQIKEGKKEGKKEEK
jgi:hypothetical protein